MNRRTTFRVLVALVVTLAIVAIFSSPLVDIPKTALRAKHLAQLILLGLVCLTTACVGIRPLAESDEVFCGSDSAPTVASTCAERILPLLC
jgi:hypothetical protein